jgi:hypothetical protein
MRNIMLATKSPLPGIVDAAERQCAKSHNHALGLAIAGRRDVLSAADDLYTAAALAGKVLQDAKRKKADPVEIDAALRHLRAALRHAKGR